MTRSLKPRGQASVGIVMYALLLGIPGNLDVLVFMWTFYHYFPISGNGSTADLKEAMPMSEKIFGHKQNTETIGRPLEYELIDLKLKAKIGGLGAMSSLMDKATTDVDLIWVVPKVKDLEYPAGKPVERIEVIIFGEPYLIEVETHILDNITCFILDCHHD